MRSGGKGVVITQLDLDAVEALGLVKIDLLGIRGLTVLGDVAEFVHASKRDQFTDALAVLDSTPADDPATAQEGRNHWLLPDREPRTACHIARDPCAQ